MTEQVVKESVSGAHTDAAFGFSEKEDGESAADWSVYYGSPTVSSVEDTDRRSNVIRIQGSPTNAAKMAGPWNSTARVASFWYKGGMSPVAFVDTGSGKAIRYYSSAGTNYYSGGHVYFYLETAAAKTSWARFERDVKADFEAVAGVAWGEIDSIVVAPDSSVLSGNFYIDDIRLSNCRTVEYNALTGGSTGQIAAQYTFSGSFPIYTVRWYHYDRLGNVMNLTDTSANVVASYDQDAYGNMISNMTTGQWASSISGRHLTTKEADADAGLYYFWQRWYEPQVARFLSRDPLPSVNPYSMDNSNPCRFIDPTGLTATDEQGAGCCRAAKMIENYLGDYVKHTCLRSCQTRCSISDDNAYAFMSKCYQECLDSIDCINAISKYGGCVTGCMFLPADKYKDCVDLCKNILKPCEKLAD